MSNPSASSTGQNVGFNVVETVMDVSKSDKENKLAPSKWNKPDIIVEPESQEFEPPRERITSRAFKKLINSIIYLHKQLN